MNKTGSTAKKPPVVRFLSSGWLRIIVSLLLLTYIGWRFRIGTIASTMWTADRLLLAGAVAVFIVSGVLGAVQWGTLLKFHGIRLGFGGTVARYFMGLFFNYLLPGFVGGDVIRVYKTAVASGQATQSFSSTLADRVIGLLVLVLFSLGAFLVLPSGPANRALPAAVFMFLILAGFIALFAFRPLGSIVKRMFGRFIPEGFGEKLSAVYGEMHLLTRSPRTLIEVFGLSCLIQITRIGVHFLCGRAVGIELGFSYFALFVPVIEIVASLPFSFGGVGVRETVAFILFSTVGVEQATVVSYTLLATASGFTGALPGGAAFALSVGERKAR
ncbi:flippase-like domain-containing protein [bacterium]|nr:flippase-like domain-containing protein [bacterium]